MTIQLPVAAQARLDAHLDAVEQSLIAAGHSRDRRRAVVDDLDAQILDMLAAQSASPTLADVEAVLSRLDPPAAYGDAGTSRTTSTPLASATVKLKKPRYSRCAIAGFICILLSFITLPLMLIPLFYMSATHTVTYSGPVTVVPDAGLEGHPTATAPTTQAHFQSNETRWSKFASLLPCLLVLVGPLGLAGTILGWIAFGQIRSSQGELRGQGLALFDGLFYPLLVGTFTIIFILIVS